MQEVLVNRLGGLSLLRKSVVRLADRPDMTLDVYRGRKTTIQSTNQPRSKTLCRPCIAAITGYVFFLVLLTIFSTSSNAQIGVEIVTWTDPNHRRRKVYNIAGAMV